MEGTLVLGRPGGIAAVGEGVDAVMKYAFELETFELRVADDNN
jgi:hypothetical protein